MAPYPGQHSTTHYTTTDLQDVREGIVTEWTQAVSALENTLVLLRDRLSPVLRPDLSATDGTSEPMPPVSDARFALNRLIGGTSEVHNLLDRLEV